MKQRVLEVENLRIEREQLILDLPSWQILDGEHWVILGPNGAGKTSLLSALLGLMDARGSIRILGQQREEDDWCALRARVGLVSTSTAPLIDPEFSALAIVAGGKDGTWIYPKPSGRRKTESLKHLQNLGLSSAAHRPWAVLSQGERTRTLIARALMANPALLILDEPCTGLDPVAREHFLHDLGHLGAKVGIPLILCTHHLEEIPPVFTHALILREGRCLAQGPIPKVFTNKILSDCYKAPITIRRQNGHWQMKIKTTKPAKQRSQTSLTTPKSLA